ncbi:MAG: nucleotidyl transferase AbiEii/AbiGii toxin family protein [Deltaproteobacteria bacterium]|nr:nucleotidyl transferase AbiEii/AbiGii toxin family protein [Deltaproteobacteria bacterium]
MSFVHDTTDFADLVRIAAMARDLEPALIEKDYWVTHALWALHQTGLDIWFKGGTSLSKAYGIIERFSEDVDLRIEPGRATNVPVVTSWKSINKGPIAQRAQFFEDLGHAMAIPGAQVLFQPDTVDKDARGAHYHLMYPGHFLSSIRSGIRPYVLLEVGVARVTPFVFRPIGSFVHDELERTGRLGDFDENRPTAVRCVHPLVTLVEKLDAISRRFRRDPMEPASFVRHYEDAARIIRALPSLPALDESPSQLIDDMLREKQIRWRPDASDPAFNPKAEEPKAVFAAYDAIAAMFWGERTSLTDACTAIRTWLTEIET